MRSSHQCAEGDEALETAGWCHSIRRRRDWLRVVSGPRGLVGCVEAARGGGRESERDEMRGLREIANA